MKRKTQEQFEKELLTVNPKIEVIGKYINSGTKIACKCKQCGYEWMPVPSNILRGSQCPRCSGHYQYTENDMREWLANNTPTIELVGEFVNISTRALFHCKKCGVKWRTRPIDIKWGGSRCPNCKHKYPTNKKDVEKALGDKNISLSNDFKNISSRATLICNVCGHEWKARVLDVLKTSGCPKCSKCYSPTPNEFKEEMKKTRPDLIVLEDYVSSSTPILFKCVTCGNEWKARPNSIKKGSGCPICNNKGKRRPRQEKAKQEFYSFIESKRKEITLLSPYVKTQSHVDVRCNRCGHEWRVQPLSLLQGSGCPNCAKRQTSFMEQFLLNALVVALGSDKVKTRNRTLINKELDIYLPSFHFAIEIGSWAWHYDKIEADLLKRILCNEKNVQLITIYDSCPLEQVDKMPDAWLYSYDLASESDYATLKTIVQSILHLLQEEYDFSETDWGTIINKTKLSSRKMNTDEFVALMSEVNPNIIILGEYVSSGAPILCKCKKCGNVWNGRPADLKRGVGCKRCADKGHRKSADEYQKWINENRPSLELLSPYITSLQPIRVRCKKCGYEWTTTPARINNGSGCASCAGTKRRTPEEFAQFIKDNRPDITLLSDYINNKCVIKCKCNICGHQWEVTAQQLLRGYGKCPKCRKNKEDHCNNK